MEEALLELLQKAEASAPHVWGIVMRQAYVDAYVRFGVAFVVMLALIGWVWAAKNEWNAIDDDTRGYAVLIGIVLLVIVIVSAGWGAAIIANPEYRAMKMLIDGFAGVLK